MGWNDHMEGIDPADPDPGERLREMADAIRLRQKEEPKEEEKMNPPYPWCIGSPTREACARRGWCNRNPNCGE